MWLIENFRICLKLPLYWTVLPLLILIAIQGSLLSIERDVTLETKVYVRKASKQCPS